MFSGDGFSDMHFVIRAVPQGEFDGWVATAKNAGKALDPAAYAQLGKPGIVPQPISFSSVDPGLFAAVTDGTIAPVPGPANAPATDQGSRGQQEVNR